MQHNEHKKKAIILSFFGVSTTLAVYIISIVCKTERIQTNTDTFSDVNWYEIILPLIVFFYFIPLLKRIHYHANLAKMKKVTVISNILIILFSGAALVALFTIVFTFISQ